MKISVAELRRTAHKVRVTHRRWYLINGGEVLRSRYEAEEQGITSQPLTCGGLTVVEVTTPNGEVLSGVADCSLNQNYHRRLGVYLALGRAMNQQVSEAKFLKEEKAQRLVNEVMFNLHVDGLGDPLDSISNDAYQRLEENLVEAVMKKL